jgi:insertion element IS1 protein InsB
VADGLAEAQPGDVLELDEVCGYVHKRRNKVWTWTALCRRTRQIVAYVNGDRSEATCRVLWDRIPQAYRRCRTFSDFWKAYASVFSEAQHLKAIRCAKHRMLPTQGSASCENTRVTHD